MAAQPPPPIVVPNYYQLALPGSNLPTAGIPGDTNEAGNVLTAVTSGITSIPVVPMVRNLTVLPNRGSVCFRNAVLHSLFSLDRFTQLLEATGFMQEQGRPIFRQLQDLAVRFRAGDPTVGAITAVDALWNTITNTPANPATPVMNPAATNAFGGRAAQEDAVEFLEYFLYRLTATEIPVDIFDLPFMNPAFRRVIGFERATRTAYDCSCPQKQRKPILLNGAIPPMWTQAKYALEVVHNPGEGATTLSDAITRTMYETANGEAESERCPTCNQGLATGRFSKFFYLPDILSIAVTHQKTRVNANGDRQEVLDFTSKIDYQERLDLSNLCERPADQGNAVYRLKASIVWQGGQNTGHGQQGRTGGHYYAYLRRETATGEYWQKLDEQASPTSVDLISGLDSVRQDQNQPRLLMYEKEQPQTGTPPSGTAEASNTGNQYADGGGGGDGGDGAGATNDPPADATYDPYITTYRVQWKPSGNAPAGGCASTATPGCCSGSQTNTGSAGDNPATGGDHSDETEGSPVSLRGGDGSDSGNGSDAGDHDGPYAGFENWTDIGRLRTAFTTEGLLPLNRNSTVDDWRDILREHLTPTRAVQYDVYSMPQLRRMIQNRGLGVKSKYKQVLADALAADDAAGAGADQTPSPAQTPPVSAAQTPPPANAAQAPPPANAAQAPPPANAAQAPPPANAAQAPPANAAQTPANAAQGGPSTSLPELPPGNVSVVQNPDAPDPALEARLYQLENLIASLENTDRPCNCPLNGQLSGDQNCQNNNANQGQACRNRGLHIRLTPSSGSQDVGSRDYWVPLAPQHDNDNLNLRVSIRVSRRIAEGLYPVRFSFSGPQPPEGGLSLLPRDAPFRNTIRFRLPFYIYPQNLNFEVWQEDIPDAPLLDTRSTDVILQPSSSAGRTRTAAEAGLDEGGSASQKPKTS